MKPSADRTGKEIVTPSQRWGALATAVAMLFLFGFFAYHQIGSTGFFADRFGPLEMVCLYGPILLSLGAPIARAWWGRQNPARLFEAATGLSLAAGSLWLAIAFPFDFAHLADVLPGAIRFVLAWITNEIGRLVLILQVIIGVIRGPLAVAAFLSARRRTAVT